MLDRDLSWLDATCRAAVEVSDRNRNLPAHIHSLLKLEIFAANRVAAKLVPSRSCASLSACG